MVYVYQNEFVIECHSFQAGLDAMVFVPFSSVLAVCSMTAFCLLWPESFVVSF